MTFSQIIFVIAGAFSIFMGATRFGMASRKMQRLARLIGELGTRLLYVAIGIALIVIAFVLKRL